MGQVLDGGSHYNDSAEEKKEKSKGPWYLLWGYEMAGQKKDTITQKNQRDRSEDPTSR